MGAGWIIGGLAVAGGLGFYFYEKAKTGVPGNPASSIDACNKAITVVNARRANMSQPANILKPAYDNWAAQCIAAGGTPPAWPG